MYWNDSAFCGYLVGRAMQNFGIIADVSETS